MPFRGSICILPVDQRSIHIFSPQWDSHRISELRSQSVLYEGVAEQYAEAAQGIGSLGEAGLPDCDEACGSCGIFMDCHGLL